MLSLGAFEVLEPLALQAISLWKRAHVAAKIAIASTAGCVSLTLLRLVYLRIRRRVKQFPPGPVGVPVFGVAFMYLFYGMNKVVIDILPSYGDVSMYSIGKSETVSINDPRIALNVFKTRQNEIDTTVHSFDTGLSWNESNKSRNAFGLSFKAVQSFRALINEESLNSRFIKNGIEHGLNVLVFPHVDKLISQGKSFDDVAELIRPMTFSLMMFAVFGVEYIF